MKLSQPLILLLIVLFTVLQATVLNFLQIFNIKPDILLILLIFFSLNGGRSYGLGLGALSGIFSESTSGLPAGSAFFVYALGGLILGHLGHWLDQQRISSQISLTLIFTFLTYLSLFLIWQSSDLGLSLFQALIYIILPACLYTALISPLLFRLLKSLAGLKI